MAESLHQVYVIPTDTEGIYELLVGLDPVLDASKLAIKYCMGSDGTPA